MSNIDWDRETDFVAVGTGIGGLTGAITADDHGLDTIVVEKAPVVGGVTSYSFGEIWVGANHLQEDQGMEDSVAEVRDYVEYMAPKQPKVEVLTALLETAPEALEFLASRANLDFQLVDDLPDYTYPEAPGAKAEGRYVEVTPIRRIDIDSDHELLDSPFAPLGITHNEMFEWGGLGGYQEWDFDLIAERNEEGYLTFGTGLIAYLLRDIERRSIPVRTNAAVVDLYENESGVAGVEIDDGSGGTSIRAREGVLLAVGSYDWNEEMVERYESSPEWGAATPPYVTGDNLSLTRSFNARVTGVPVAGAMGYPPGLRIPGEEQIEGKPIYRTMINGGLPGSIIVNAEGDRFANEAFWYDIIAKIARFDVIEREYPNWPAYLIFDQEFRDNYPLGPIEPGAELPSGVGKTAETLEGLADAMDIAPAGLRETVEAFNETARDGYDPEFERGELPWQNFMSGDLTKDGNPNLSPITEPPFYGIELGVAASGSGTYGLDIDSGARVLDNESDAIGGLYAAGNSVAYVDTGGGYQSGWAICRGMTYGYLAGKDAAQG